MIICRMLIKTISKLVDIGHILETLKRKKGFGRWVFLDFQVFFLSCLRDEILIGYVE